MAAVEKTTIMLWSAGALTCATVLVAVRLTLHTNAFTTAIANQAIEMEALKKQQSIEMSALQQVMSARMATVDTRMEAFSREQERSMQAFSREQERMSRDLRELSAQVNLLLTRKSNDE